MVEPAERAPGEREILNALETSVKLPPVDAAYRLGLLVVGVTMVVLPVLYLGIIVLVGYSVYSHAVNHVGILDGGGVRFRFLAYITPIVAGAILVLFMIKPIFARPAVQPLAHLIRRSDAPLLFAFVERLCRLLNAPVPSRIQADVQINASAGLDLHMVTMTRKETILTIGLPLVAGMGLKELTGVLAHEFGHFRQGSGMRFSQLIRRVNHWFGRVVYERDEWDQRLAEWSKVGGWSSLIVLTARLCVWITRGLLWVLMMVGHGISSFFMRQMEFNADQYEVLVAGSDTFARSALRLRVLTVANQVTFAELSDSWNEGRLSDNLPLHITSKADALPKDTIESIRETSLREYTGLFDTHPCDRDRIQRAEGMQAPGIFRLRAPATVLFRDFEAVAKRVTLEFYRQTLGNVRRESLVSTEAFQAQQDQHRSGEQAAYRYFFGILSASRVLPLKLKRLDPPANPKAALRNLLCSRMYLEENRPQAKRVYAEFGQAREMSTNAFLASHLLDVGLAPDRESFHLPAATPQGVERLRERASSMSEEKRPFIEEWEQKLRLRLISALQCLLNGEMRAKIPDADALQSQANRLVACQYDLQLALPEIVEMGDKRSVLELLANQLGNDEEDEPVLRNMAKLARLIQSDIVSVLEGIKVTPYPFVEKGEEITCAQYLLRDVPEGHAFAFGGNVDAFDGETLAQIYQASQELGQRYFTLHLRVLGQLALIAEKVEEAAGLPPLPEPGDGCQA